MCTSPTLGGAQTADIRFGVMDSNFLLIAETFVTVDATLDRGFLYATLPPIYTQIPDVKYLLFGANNPVNGGQTVRFKRVNSNSTNNNAVSFTFNLPNGGGMPVDLSNPAARGATNNVFYLNAYSE